jgi:hypothetical protein
MRKASHLVLLLAGLGCTRAVPAADATAVSAPDAGTTPRERLEARVDALDDEAGAVLAATDEVLWQHWTQGAPLDLATAAVGHEALFAPATLELLRQAQAQGAAPRRAALLEQWLLHERLSRALVPDAEGLASLEASATFSSGGREVPWRDLPRLLVSERSAVKRRALWAASLPVAGRLDALIAHREERAQAALAEVGAPPPDALRARTRELDLPALAVTARELLEATDGLWRRTLGELSQAELRLPVEALTRADLPRLLRVPPAVDAAFPGDAIGPRLVDTLAALGLGSRPGLAFDLALAPAKQPLPLTVAPSPARVRVSFKPAGGLRDQRLLLSEAGAGLALSLAATPFASTNRLGDPARVGVLAALFAGLAEEPGWQAARGVPEAQREPAARQARALSLYALRHAAALVLLHAEPPDLPEAEARARAVKTLALALGVKVAPEEGVRLRVELDDGLRGATELKASLAAAVLRQRLGEGWWSAPERVVPALEAAFAPGASQPFEAAWGPPAAGLEALLRRLGLPAAN